jgi:Arc/MetJ family transcription regulator
MATNLALDPELVDEVLKVSGEQTNHAAVTLALREFIERRAQQNLIGYFGQVEGDDSVDYKADRR